MARSTRTLFLDANVLAAPVTRTLLLVGIEAIAVVATWSRHAEVEANKHLRSRAMSITDLRTTILESDLSQTGENPSRFVGTKGADRQILADAVAGTHDSTSGSPRSTPTAHGTRRRTRSRAFSTAARDASSADEQSKTRAV